MWPVVMLKHDDESRLVTCWVHAVLQLQEVKQLALKESIRVSNSSWPDMFAAQSAKGVKIGRGANVTSSTARNSETGLAFFSTTFEGPS